MQVEQEQVRLLVVDDGDAREGEGVRRERLPRPWLGPRTLHRSFGQLPRRLSVNRFRVDTARVLPRARP